MDRNCRLMPLPVLPQVTPETRSLQNTTRVPRWMRCSAKCVSALFVWQTLLAVPVQVYAATKARERSMEAAIAAVSRPASPKHRHVIPHVTSGLPTVAQTGTIQLTLQGNLNNTEGDEWYITQGDQLVADGTDTYGWEVTLQSDGSLILNVPGDAPLGDLTVVYGATTAQSASFTVIRPATSERSGPAYPWEGSYDGVNTSTGDKLTSVPIAHYPVRGGMSVDFTLYHNSESAQSLTLGHKWSHSYEAYLTQPVDSNGNLIANRIAVHWGNDLSYVFVKNVSTGKFMPPTAIFDTLTLNADGGYTLTTKSQTKYVFNAQWKLASISDRSNNTISLIYTSGLLTQISDPTGTRNLTLTYNGLTGTAARLVSVKDPLNHTYTLEYDTTSHPRLTKVDKPLRSTDGTTKYTGFTYDDGDNLASIKTPANRTWTYGYFTDGSLLWEKDPLGNETNFTYTTTYNYVQAANGAFVAEHDYTNGLLTETFDSNGATQYVYNSQNLPTQITDGRGKAWNYTYSNDGKGNLLTAKDPLNVTTTYAYTPLNDVASVSQPIDTNLSSLTTYTYTGGLLTQITDPMLHHTNYGYDENGLLISITDDLTASSYTHQWGFKHNPWGDIETIFDGLQHGRKLLWDAGGNVTSVTDANDNGDYWYFDDWDIPIRTEYPPVPLQASIFGGSPMAKSGGETLSPLKSGLRLAGYKGRKQSGLSTPTTSTVYDDDGLPLIETDQNGHRTLYTYDLAGRVTQVETERDFGVSDFVKYGYDGNIPGSTQTVSNQAGLLTAVLDGNGNTLLYGYDQYARVTSRVYPDTQFVPLNSPNSVTALAQETYTYDFAGNLLTVKDRSNSTTTYVYDDAGQLSQITYPTGTPTAYTYYPDGEAKTMTDATGTTTYVLDPDRKLTQLQRPSPIGNVSYFYDVADRQTRTMTAAGNIVYTYDEADNLKTVKSPQNEVTTYSYDPANRMTHIALANGATTDYTYDNDDRVTLIAQKDPTGTTQLTHAYGYDMAGNVTLRTDTRPGVPSVQVAYGYDKRDQLKIERAQRVSGSTTTALYQHEYNYDSNLNRTRKTVTSASGAVTTEDYTYYPKSDRLQTAGNKTYSYDARGNVTNIATGTGTNPSNTSNTAFGWNLDNRLTSLTPASGTASTSLYNGSGLRTKKTVGSAVTNYLTDGDDPASALLSDGATYVPGVSERRGSTTNYFLFDLLGSVRATSDATGAANEFSLTDAFGNPVTTSGFGGATTTRPFGFVGGEQYQTDAESGLQLLGNRYYDPTIGRFLSSDPAEDGDNYYVYVANNPTRFVDPEGHQVAQALLKGAAASQLLGGGPLDPIADVVSIGLTIGATGVLLWDWVHSRPPVPISLSKHIPSRGPGPSGKPKIHKIRKATQKAARDAAKKAGKGKPIHHPNDKGQPPHYHPGDGNGEPIKDGTHYYYPPNGPQYNE